LKRNEGWRTQIDEEPVTEEDLELIKERETNIRQLEVSEHFLYDIISVPKSSFLQDPYANSSQSGIKSPQRTQHLFGKWEKDDLILNS